MTQQEVQALIEKVKEVNQSEKRLKNVVCSMDLGQVILEVQIGLN